MEIRQPEWRVTGQRDAPLGGRETRRRDMQKNSTAFSWNDRDVVVTKNDNHVVKTIIAPQLLMASLVRQRYQPIVIFVGRIVAPPV